MKTKPTIRIATAKAMPKMDAAARSGWRATLRSTIRPAVPEVPGDERRLEQRPPVARRRLRPHRLGRRHADGAAHRRERAGRRRRRASWPWRRGRR